MTLPASFWDKTTQPDCIVWAGAQNSRGYGCYGIGGRSHLAHRLAWEDAHGPIPDGLTLDHLCRNRSCVNVEHLQLVSGQENTRRAIALRIGQECKRGHLIASKDDLYQRTTGLAECRECRRVAAQRFRDKQEVAS